MYKIIISTKYEFWNLYIIQTINLSFSIQLATIFTSISQVSSIQFETMPRAPRSVALPRATTNRGDGVGRLNGRLCEGFAEGSMQIIKKIRAGNCVIAVRGLLYDL